MRNPVRVQTSRMVCISPGVPMVWTIGHSNRSLEEFLALLAAQRIEAIADVRRFPGSLKHPHFAGAQLALSLPRHGIAYHWIAQLGGRRRVQPGSRNNGWRNASFQGYADHLATQEFADGLDELLAMAGGLRTAVMCSEALWWRCHRSLISDVLRYLGAQVLHISDARHTTVHPYTSPARIVDGELSYAAD